MAHHILACGLCGNNPQSSVGWVVVIGGILAIAVIGLIGHTRQENRRRAGKPPRQLREPTTDISPGMLSLLTGQKVSAYTAPVNAVTPRGIRVRQSRCCTKAHRSPAQAVAHANAIKRRIETTGR
jgi:hypothetical protein